MSDATPMRIVIDSPDGPVEYMRAEDSKRMIDKVIAERDAERELLRRMTVERNYWRDEAEAKRTKDFDEGRQEERNACAYYLRANHPDLADAIKRGEHDDTK